MLVIASALTLLASADADSRDRYLPVSAAWPTAAPSAAVIAAPATAAALAAEPRADLTPPGICRKPPSKLWAASFATALSFGARSFTAAAAVEETGERAALAVLATDLRGWGIALAALFITDFPAPSTFERPDFTAPATGESLEDTPEATPENASVTWPTALLAADDIV